MKVTSTQDGVAVPEVLLAREQDKNQLALASRQGSLTRIRRGAYCKPDAIRADGPASASREKRSRELARARALHRQLRSKTVFSHTTAALLLGCPVWAVPDRTHVYQRYRPSSRAAKDVVRHVGTVPADAVVTVRGLPVTSLARTVVDCSLALHPLEALVVADFALGQGVDRAELLAELDHRAERRGVRRARLVLELADGGSDSPWETWVRYEILRTGLPRPVTQMPVSTDRGVFHTDLGYAQWNLGIEFDGLVKYRPDGVGTGHDPAREFMNEKGRAEAIRRAGITVERVAASDRSQVPAMLAASRPTCHPTWCGRHASTPCYRRPDHGSSPGGLGSLPGRLGSWHRDRLRPGPISMPTAECSGRVPILWRESRGRRPVAWARTGTVRPGENWASPPGRELGQSARARTGPVRPGDKLAQKKQMRPSPGACDAPRTVIGPTLEALADRPNQQGRSVRARAFGHGADRKEAVMDEVVRAAAPAAADATVTRSTRD